MASRFADLVDSLVNTLLTSNEDVPAGIRAAAFQRAATADGAREENELPVELRELVDKIALHAYRVTDTDIEMLRAAGYTEDQLFEIILSAATGAAWTRLDRGLSALKAGT